MSFTSGSIPIQPFEKLETTTITNVNMRIVDYTFFNSITVMCSLVTNDGRTVDNKYIVVDGEEFANWGSDDSYIVNLILSKLGFQQPVSQEPVSQEPAVV